MEKNEIRELIDHFGIYIRPSNNEELLMITKNVADAKKRQDELKLAKPSIIAYIHEQENEEKRKREEIEKQFENGTLPIEVRETTHYSRALDMVVTENQITGDPESLSKLMGSRDSGYYTDLPPGKYPISVLPAWQKMQAKKLQLEAKFKEAKETGKRVLVSKKTAPCNEPDCSLDEIYTYAMPDGSLKEERIHTY